MIIIYLDRARYQEKMWTVANSKELLLSNKIREAGKRAQLIRWLLCKCEHLRPDPQHPYKGQVWWCAPITLALGAGRREKPAGPWSLLARLVESMSSPFNKRSWMRKTSTSMCTHVHVYRPAQMHTYSIHTQTTTETEICFRKGQRRCHRDVGRNKTCLLGQGRQKGGAEGSELTRAATAWDKTDSEENMCICSRSLSVFVCLSLSIHFGP